MAKFDGEQNDKHNWILRVPLGSKPELTQWPSFREEVRLASAQQWSFQRNGGTGLEVRVN